MSGKVCDAYRALTGGFGITKFFRSPNDKSTDEHTLDETEIHNTVANALKYGSVVTAGCGTVLKNGVCFMDWLLNGVHLFWSVLIPPVED